MFWPTSRKSIMHQILKQIRAARFESRQQSMNFSFMNSFAFEFCSSSVNYHVSPREIWKNISKSKEGVIRVNQENISAYFEEK